jgi:hypothetical protein
MLEENLETSSVMFSSSPKLVIFMNSWTIHENAFLLFYSHTFIVPAPNMNNDS